VPCEPAVTGTVHARETAVVSAQGEAPHPAGDGARRRQRSGWAGPGSARPMRTMHAQVEQAQAGVEVGAHMQAAAQTNAAAGGRATAEPVLQSSLSPKKRRSPQGDG